MYATVLNSDGVSEAGNKIGPICISLTVLAFIFYSPYCGCCGMQGNIADLVIVSKEFYGTVKGSASHQPFLVLAFSRPNSQAGLSRGYDMVNIIRLSEILPSTGQVIF